MQPTPNPRIDPYQPTVYQIRIGGHLGPRWEGWFGHMAITQEANGVTAIIGPVVDQAQLHGILTKIRDLGLPLLSVTRMDIDQDAHDRKDQT